MGDVNLDPICPECMKRNPSIVNESTQFVHFECSNCSYKFVIPKSSPKYTITRDDSNKHFTSEPQAIKVAEKLALENPDHTYFISKIIYKSKAASAITVKVE